MRVTILNQYCENRGDEAAGEALVKDLLQIPKVERIDIIYNSAFKLNIDHPKVHHRNEDLLLKKIGIWGIARYLLFRRTLFKSFAYANTTMKEMARTIRESDIIFVTPCGASIGIYKDWPFLIRLIFCLYERQQPVFYLDTVGKSGNFVFDWLASAVMKKSKMYVREKASYEYLKSIGIPSVRGVDTAFSLPPFYGMRSEQKIGVVTTQLDWHPDFRNQDMNEVIQHKILPGIAEFVISHHYEIDLIPHIADEKELSFLKKFSNNLIKAGVSPSNVHIRRDVRTAEEYDRTIASEHLIVGMRYHSIVLAAKNAVPFVSLAYENKMKEVSHYTGFDNNCFDLHQQISSDKISAMLERVDKESQNISIQLKEIYPKLREMALIPLEQIESKKDDDAF